MTRTCVRHPIASTSWFGALVLVFALTAAEARCAHLIRTDVGSAVPSTQLLATLSQSGVIATLDEGESFKFLGQGLIASERSILYLSLSSQYRIAALLSGAVVLEATDDTLRPGEVAVWPDRGGRPRIRAFDIDRFLASSSAALPADAVASLQNAAERQRVRIWWGALRRTAENAQAPLPPLFEAMRRDVLLRPVVIELRQEAAGDSEQLARLTAARFMASLRDRDVAAVRDLMAPSLFSPDHHTPSAWLQLRHDIARSLIASELGRALAGGSLADGDLESGFVVETPDGDSYRLRMSAEEQMVFIAEIVPEGRP